MLQRLFGLEPVPVPPHIFALGRARLRYARFLGGAGGWRLAELHGVELPEESFGAGPLGAPARDPADLRGRVGALLERVSGGVAAASLVLPDAWLRVAFVDSGELPRDEKARDEVLRWRLRRLVPFRVDDLRVVAAPAAPLPGVRRDESEPYRLMLGFAVEALLAQVEEAFAAHGVRLGQITSESLALLAAVGPALAGEELAAVALVAGEGYSLAALAGGEVALLRLKGLRPGPQAAAGVERDLRLTASFLATAFPGRPVGRCVLVTPPARAAEWSARLAAALAVRPEPLVPLHLGLAPEGVSDGSWHELAPLLGAAAREVA